jgi:hypothetical protein
MEDFTVNGTTCTGYTQCVYDALLHNLASSDAAATDLAQAQATCSPSVPTMSTAPGNALIACLAAVCHAPCLGV